MKIREIIDLLSGDLICGEDVLDNCIYDACGSDLMSDVLAYSGNAGLLVTGLVNPQVVRTAEMMDIHCIVFARGKCPSTDMIEMAKERKIALVKTALSMFNTCGTLYSSGLRGG